jgi:hypothetical protein
MSQCQRPPAGWYCNLEEGHEGPCPTRSRFTEPDAMMCLDYNEKFQRNCFLPEFHEGWHACGKYTWSKDGEAPLTYGVTDMDLKDKIVAGLVITFMAYSSVALVAGYITLTKWIWGLFTGG